METIKYDSRIMPIIAVTMMIMKEFNSPILKQKLSDCIKKQNHTIFCIQETYIEWKDAELVKTKAWIWIKSCRNPITWQSWN